jgi:hypothetical protein
MPTFLTQDASHDQVWIHALFFATRQLGDPKPLIQILDQDHALAPNLRHLVEIELLAETGRIDDAHQALRALRANMPYGAYYQVSELTALGFPDEALHALALNNNAGFLTGHDAAALRLEAYAAKGLPSLRRNEVEIVLGARTSASPVDLLCAHLIRHPDPELVAALFEKVRREPLPPAIESFQTTAALFCTAGVNADWPDMRAAYKLLKQLSGSNFTALDLLESFFRGQTEQQLGNVLPILQPLPLDVTYALFEHYSGKPAAPAP